MALRLFLRRSTAIPPLRVRPAADTEIADEVPKKYYIVKDYDRNPFYNAYNYVNRPGSKKQYDPFLKASERVDHAWRPRHYG